MTDNKYEQMLNKAIECDQCAELLNDLVDLQAQNEALTAKLYEQNQIIAGDVLSTALKCCNRSSDVYSEKYDLPAPGSWQDPCYVMSGMDLMIEKLEKQLEEERANKKQICPECGSAWVAQADDHGFACRDED
jgi:hypothetical protein